MLELLQHIQAREIKDTKVLQELLVMSLNVIEQQAEELAAFREEIQSLKDEINRLKGEEGQPKFKSKSRLSSFGSREAKSKTSSKKRSKNHKKGGKSSKIPIDKIELSTLSEADLPSDAVLKYYDKVIQQDLQLIRVNTLYKVGVYYSPTLQKPFRAPYPSTYQGAFGSGLQSLTHLLHHYCDVTQGRLEALYKSCGVLISSGTICNILLRSHDWAVKEQVGILKSGIAHSPYTQIDGTKSVEKGVRKTTQIICGAYFSVFYTLGDKSRQSVLKAIMGNPEDGLKIAYNHYSQSLLNYFGVAQKDQAFLKAYLTKDKVLSLKRFDAEFKTAAPQIYQKRNMYTRIKEALCLGYYHVQTEFPRIEDLLSDDAPEYRKIVTTHHALCWIHDERYYKKLNPKIRVHRTILEQTLETYWEFYRQLLDFKTLPDEAQATQKDELLKRFDTIFTQQTDYFQLNQCLERTLKNKDKLLAVLENPALPLHNNNAELGARRIVRKRDISLHTWSEKGTQVRDAFLSIVQTAEKLGISALDYIQDRVTKKYQIPSLEHLIIIAYS